MPQTTQQDQDLHGPRTAEWIPGLNARREPHFTPGLVAWSPQQPARFVTAGLDLTDITTGRETLRRLPEDHPGGIAASWHGDHPDSPDTSRLGPVPRRNHASRQVIRVRFLPGGVFQGPLQG
jgi:hypothetical protein